MNLNIEDIARVAHEANRAMQIINGEADISPGWDDAPDWQRESAVDGVKKALAGATPEELHQSWCDFKTAEGWVYGPVKDPEAKTHPCLVPYGDLPAGQRAKDALFQSVVFSLTEGAS